MKPLGTFLANLRSSMGLSLEELALLVDTSKSTLSRLEHDDVPRPFTGSVRQLFLSLAELLCTSPQELTQYLALADIEQTLLTETEKIRLGILPHIVAGSASEAQDLQRLYRITRQFHQHCEHWEQQVQQFPERKAGRGERNALLHLRRKKQEYALLLRSTQQRLEQVQRRQATTSTPDEPMTGEPCPSEGASQALANYLERQQTRLLDARAPGSTNLRVRDIVGKDGLFIAPAWRASEHVAPTIDVSEYLLDALTQGQRVLLLGEAGQGKTTLLKRVFTRLAERFLSGSHPQTPLPLYLPLRELPPVTGNALEVVWAYLHDEFPLSFEEFAALVRSARIVLLLDGFDEMPGELTQRAINERAMSKVFALPAILTCRKNFYEFYLSMSALQEQYPRQVELLPLRLTQSVTDYIAAFCQKKQEHLLLDSITPSEQIVETIRANQGLRDLAQRPLLLVMMLDIFTDLREVHNSEWDIAKLYQKYTEKWLKNEATKPDSVLRWNEKAALIQEIAWSLYVTRGPATSSSEQYQSGTFTQQDLFHLLERFATRYSHIPPRQLLDDICFRTFLIANEGDNYYFIHKSFQEYYVARYIFEHMRGGMHHVKDVARVLQEFLSVEVVGFLKQMLGAKDVSRRERELVIDVLIGAYQQNGADDSRSVATRQNASAYLAFLGTEKAVEFLERTYQEEPNKWVQRGMMVGLALFCGKREVLDRYIDILLKDSEAASINIGYHLAYYGDQAPEEGYYDQGGKQCAGTLQSIFRHLSNERYRDGWVLDLLTLRTLLEQRGIEILRSDEQFQPFLEAFLDSDHQGQRKAFQQEKARLQEIMKVAVL